MGGRYAEVFAGGSRDAVVACGGDKATGPESVSGNYTLRTVNGGNVPAVAFQNTTVKGEIVSSNSALATDNSWTATVTVRTTDLTTGDVFPEALPSASTYSL